MGKAAQDPAERYLVKVDRRKDDECWDWTAACFQNGYGAFRLGDKQVKAHRFGYQLARGPIGTGLIVCHTCDNRKCQNPNHMFLGTHRDNALDRDNKRRGRYMRVYRVALPRARGERSGVAKLTDENIHEIRAEWARGKSSQQSLADRYGVTQKNVSNIVNRKTWTHI